MVWVSFIYYYIWVIYYERDRNLSFISWWLWEDLLGFCGIRLEEISFEILLIFGNVGVRCLWFFFGYLLRGICWLFYY